MINVIPEIELDDSTRVISFSASRSEEAPPESCSSTFTGTLIHACLEGLRPPRPPVGEISGSSLLEQSLLLAELVKIALLRIPFRLGSTGRGATTSLDSESSDRTEPDSELDMD